MSTKSQMDALLSWAPIYVAKFDPPAVWDHYTCTGRSVGHDVRLALNEVTIGGFEGVTPHIYIDGIEQIAWEGPRNNYIGHITGSCLDALRWTYESHTWQFMICPRDAQTLPYIFTDIFGSLMSMGRNESDNWYGVAKHLAVDYVLSNFHMKEIEQHYDPNNTPGSNQLTAPEPDHLAPNRSRWHRHSMGSKKYQTTGNP